MNHRRDKINKQKIPITFNNPLKAFFSNKKYLIEILTRPTHIVKVYFFFKI